MNNTKKRPDDPKPYFPPSFLDRPRSLNELEPHLQRAIAVAYAEGQRDAYDTVLERTLWRRNPDNATR